MLSEQKNNKGNEVLNRACCPAIERWTFSVRHGESVRCWMFDVRRKIWRRVARGELTCKEGAFPLEAFQFKFAKGAGWHKLSQFGMCGFTQAARLA